MSPVACRSQAMAVSIFTTALEHFFEKLLPTQLLYRFERLQVRNLFRR